MEVKSDEFFYTFKMLMQNWNGELRTNTRPQDVNNFTCFQREEAVEGARDLQQQVEGQEEEVPRRAGLHGETGPDVPEQEQHERGGELHTGAGGHREEAGNVPRGGKGSLLGMIGNFNFCKI